MIEAMPSPGADSIISTFCGAISGRLAAALPRHARRRVVRSLGHAARGDGKYSDDGRGASSTRSWGFKGAEPIPFSGANSTFSSRCGAISGRARFAVRPSRAAAKTPQCMRPTTGSCRPAFARRATRRASTHRLQAAAAGTATASTEPDTRPSRSGRQKGTNVEQSYKLVKKLLVFLETENRRRFPLRSQKRRPAPRASQPTMPTSNSKAYPLHDDRSAPLACFTRRA